MFAHVSFAVQCMRLFTSKDWIFSQAPVLAHERYREGCWCQTMLLNERTGIRELQFKVPLLCQAQFVALQNLALEWHCERNSLLRIFKNWKSNFWSLDKCQDLDSPNCETVSSSCGLPNPLLSHGEATSLTKIAQAQSPWFMGAACGIVAKASTTSWVFFKPIMV